MPCAALERIVLLVMNALGARLKRMMAASSSTPTSITGPQLNPLHPHGPPA
jgi:hypothetical protein